MIVAKDDYHILLLGCVSERKYTVIELDCGENYGALPCRKWEGDIRSIP